MAEKDQADESIEGLRESLTEMKAGNIARQYTPEQLLLQKARSSLHLSQAKFAKLVDTPAASTKH